MSRRSFLGWLLNTPPPLPSTRLTAAEAVALAAADPRVKALGQPLSMTSIADRDGRLVWSIISPTIGMQWWVEVDDATGEVSELIQAGPS